MKKLLLLVVMFSFISCASHEASPNEHAVKTMNPSMQSFDFNHASNYDVDSDVDSNDADGGDGDSGE